MRLDDALLSPPMVVGFVCERSVEARQRRVTNALNLRGVNRDCSSFMRPMTKAGLTRRSLPSLMVRWDRVIDYWHAVEYLGKLIDSSSLKGKPKTQWRKTQKNRLYRGDIGLVIIAIEQLIGEEPSEDQT